MTQKADSLVYKFCCVLPITVNWQNVFFLQKFTKYSWHTVFGKKLAR